MPFLCAPLNVMDDNPFMCIFRLSGAQPLHERLARRFRELLRLIKAEIFWVASFLFLWWLWLYCMHGVHLHGFR
jgi:hypothetical protein